MFLGNKLFLLKIIFCHCRMLFVSAPLPPWLHCIVRAAVNIATGIGILLFPPFKTGENAKARKAIRGKWEGKSNFEHLDFFFRFGPRGMPLSFLSPQLPKISLSLNLIPRSFFDGEKHKSRCRSNCWFVNHDFFGEKEIT